MDRVRPDYSVPITFGEGERFLMSPKYDTIHGYKWLGHAILRVLTDEGMAHVHVDYETAERVSEATDIPITECEFILESDHERYLEASASMLDVIFADEDFDEEVDGSLD